MPGPERSSRAALRPAIIRNKEIIGPRLPALTRLDQSRSVAWEAGDGVLTSNEQVRTFEVIGDGFLGFVKAWTLISSKPSEVTSPALVAPHGRQVRSRSIGPLTHRQYFVDFDRAPCIEERAT